MKYMLLIYSDPAARPVPGTAEFGKVLEDYQAFGKRADQAGVLMAGDALQATATATTVRMHNGNKQTTDGPFAETKETLGGFYMLDCKDLDEALSYAAQIPAVHHGCVEVRPVMTFD